jgi:polygalacturonase
MVNGLARVLSTILIFLYIIDEGYGQDTKGQRLNVRDFQATGDGMTDDTEAIQEAIRQAAEGDTVFIPPGAYLVRSLGLKSGINIKGEGMLIQRIDGDKEAVSNEKQNSSSPLFRGHRISNVYLSINAQTTISPWHKVPY